MENPTPLSGVTSKGVSPGWGTVVLSLALENGQKGAILSMAHVFYIPESPANLISLAKLNDVGLYWDNKTWNLYDTKRTGQIVGYVPKWRQNWVFRIWDMDIKDIAVGITKIDADTYQWPIDNTFSVLSVMKAKSENLSVWHCQLVHLNIIPLCKCLKRL